MPAHCTLVALAERLKEDHQQVVLVASLSVIGLSALNRLEQQGVSIQLLRTAALDCVLAYLQLNKIERAEFDLALQAIKRAGLMLGSPDGPGH